MVYCYCYIAIVITHISMCVPYRELRFHIVKLRSTLQQSILPIVTFTTLVWDCDFPDLLENRAQLYELKIGLAVWDA